MEIGQDVTLLIKAFETFRKASSTLESYYKGLEQRIEDLNMEVAEQNNYLTCVMEGMPVGVIVTDSDLKIKTVNNAACGILGKKREKLIGDCLVEQFSIQPPANQPLRHAGHCIQRKIFENISSEEMEACAAGNDKRRRTVAISATPLKNLHGQETGRLFVVRDISDMKRLRESAERDKRLAAMGEMAASLAHQIRNPLGSMELFASVLKEDLRGDKDKQKLADGIVQAVRSLNAAISNMLIFANNSRPVKTAVPLGDLISEIMNVCGFMLLDRSASIRFDHQAAGASILADKELLKQALLNLIMNAVDAVREKEGGAITIQSRQDNDGLHIMVSDNGCGICNADVERVFDPFFTTKPRGTGLGLTVVNNIIKAHDGFIEVESSEGKGTTFDMIFRQELTYA